MKRILFILAAFAAGPVVAMEGHNGMDHSRMEASAEVAMAEGKVNRIDADAATINVSHGPIPDFNWPPMTMDLKVADTGLLGGIQEGDEITFHLERLSPTEYVIVDLEQKGS